MGARGTPGHTCRTRVSAGTDSEVRPAVFALLWVLGFFELRRFSISRTRLNKLFSQLIPLKLSKLCSSFLTSKQYGFVPNRSTCKHLSVTQNIIIQSFELNAQTDIIYTDFSKAFDRVNYQILMRKLQAFGFSGSLLLWFQIFLFNRIQIVKHLNFQSAQFHVPSGVPRGDHLSTLLFNIFINDLSDAIKNSDILTTVN